MVFRNGKYPVLVVCVMCVLPAIDRSGTAQASTLERLLIMPGPVAEVHAEFEDDCNSCHSPLSDGEQADLCIACHEEVGADIVAGEGFHGRLDRTRQRDCSGCHTDHEGRDATIDGLDEEQFDHAMTDFVLHGAHTRTSCGDCHRSDRSHRSAPTTCIGCHREDDPHRGQLGDSCGDCHNEAAWTETVFDHASTGFTLTGGHAAVTCSGCHRSESFADVGKECSSCHEKDDVHKGRNGTACADCHGVGNWAAVTFDHHRVSGFALDGGHRGLGCQDCHRAADFRDLGNETCNGCHADDDVHKGRNGPDCASCHRTSAWKTVNFDHGRETGFPLPHGHDKIDCTGCHTGDLSDPLPRDCGGCHEKDDPHRGQLGTRCEDCHGETDWTTQVRFDHDLTEFPLVGVHGTTACSDCHETSAFLDAESACVACHAKDDPHDTSLGASCEVCHNPADWRTWFFDHDAQTAFRLTGAHAGLECGACHTKPMANLSRDTRNCSACHSRDDPHAGRFGNDCSNCHTTTTFTQIEAL